MFASFFFSLPKWLAFHDEKRFASLFFFVALVGFFGTSGVNLDFGWRALGPDWEFSGIPPAWVLFWGVPPFRDFGYTLKWSFLKVDPVLSIWVFLISSFGFHGFMLNRTVDKIQNASRQRNFNLIFLLYKFFELLQLLLKFKGQFLFLLTPVLIQLRRVNI